MSDELRDFSLSMYFKSVFQVLSFMYGQIDTSDLTVGRESLRSETSEIDPAYAIHWLICTLLTCIILMNLLIGLTIGDVGEIEKKADCQVVQIKLRKMYFNQVFWTNVLSPCSKIGICGKIRGPKTTLIVFPNKFVDGCAFEDRTGCLAGWMLTWTANHILGCSQVRKKVLEKFKERYDLN